MTMTIPLVLAETAAASGRLATFLSGFPHLLGMLVVMITLTVLWGLCVLTSKVIHLLMPGLAAPEPVPARAAAAPATSPEMVAAIAAVAHEEQFGKVPPEIVAVIAAAVHAAVGKDSRVVSIKPSDSNWERAGRQAVFGSHRFRH